MSVAKRKFFGEIGMLLDKTVMAVTVNGKKYTGTLSGMDPDTLSVSLSDAKDEILLSGTNWITADVSALATEANATSNKDEILASGNLYWQTATGFATPTNVTDAKDEILASGTNWETTSSADIVSDIFGYNIDGKTASGVLQIMLSYAQGNVDVSGNTFTYYAQDDATSLWSTELSGTARDRL